MQENKDKRKRFIEVLIYLVILLIPFLIVLHDVFFSNINFWYDPARDFLLAWDNLGKLSLIGPTSGIPGIFYGPYWIWLISIVMIFSKNPSIVIFLILTLPYFIVVPFVLYKFRKIFGFVTTITIWLLFIFSKGIYYAENPWNPHLAPLIFIVLIYYIVFTDFSNNRRRNNIKLIILGLLSGLILNFHISFGLGVFGGVLLYLMFTFFEQIRGKKKKNRVLLMELISIMVFFALGVLITFLPYLVFEIRHGFGQSKSILNLLTASGSVVQVTGLSRELIIGNFFGNISILLRIPFLYSLWFLLLGSFYFIYKISKKEFILLDSEKKLITLLLSICLGILVIYLATKNPVWPYHFIGVEMVFLFIIGLIINRSKLFRAIALILAVYTLLLNTIDIPRSFRANQLTSHSLATQEYIVKTINRDAEREGYTVFAYSPSVYVFEYEYLFRWIAGRDVPHDPNSNRKDSKLVYLIIQPTSAGIKQDFVNSHTPQNRYKTVRKWIIPDGTEILKRVRL